MVMKHNTYISLNLQNETFSGNFDPTFVITCYFYILYKTSRQLGSATTMSL